MFGIQAVFVIEGCHIGRSDSPKVRKLHAWNTRGVGNNSEWGNEESAGGGNSQFPTGLLQEHFPSTKAS